MDRFGRIVATPLIGIVLVAGCGQRDATPDPRPAGGTPAPPPAAAAPISAESPPPAAPATKAHVAGHERPSRDRPGRERPSPDG